MNIKDCLEELEAKKAVMEQKMATALSQIMKEFERETGITPSSIGVDMADVSSIGGRYSRSVIHRVKCEVII